MRVEERGVWVEERGGCRLHHRASAWVTVSSIADAPPHPPGPRVPTRRGGIGLIPAAARPLVVRVEGGGGEGGEEERDR